MSSVRRQPPAAGRRRPPRRTPAPPPGPRRPPHRARRGPGGRPAASPRVPPRRPRPRALQADLPEVERRRREVRVRRVVLVQPPDRGIAEQHGAAAVRLEPVLVRIDDERVGGGGRRERPLRRGVEIVGEPEEAAVRRVDVEPETDASHRRRSPRSVDRAEACRAGVAMTCRRRRAPAAATGPRRPSARSRPRHRRRTGCRGLAQTARACSAPRSDSDHPPGWSARPPTAPRGSRWCRRRQVPEMLSKPNIPASSAMASLLHRRAGPTAVERVVVGVEPHRRRVGSRATVCGGLSIWPGIARRAVREVVGEPLDEARRAPPAPPRPAPRRRPAPRHDPPGRPARTG